MPFAPHVRQQDSRRSLPSTPFSSSCTWRSHPKGTDAFIVALVTGAHLALVAAMMAIPGFRSAIATAPVFVRFIEAAAPAAKSPPAPEAPAAPPPKPVSKPAPKPLSKPAPAPPAPAATNSILPPQPETAPAPEEPAESNAAHLPASNESAAEVSGPKTVSISSVRYIVKPDPAYPALSRQRGEEGKVTLRVLVDAGGKADTIELSTSSGHSRLDEAAIQAVRRARFQPWLEGQRAIPVWVLIPIAFNLEQN
ncbi:MAG: TonB family protein [Betaproteobacteria bacterium]|nr:TonB family protein [Betaproteobacteria bacterium]